MVYIFYINEDIFTFSIGDIGASITQQELYRRNIPITKIEARKVRAIVEDGYIGMINCSYRLQRILNNF